MNPLFHTGFSISDSLKSVRKSVLIYETIIDGAAIVVVDVTVTDASADGTGFKGGLKLSHVGIKKRF